MDPLTKEDIERMVAGPDDEIITEPKEFKFHMAQAEGMGDPIPCEVSVSPNFGIYVRTVIDNKIVDVQIMCPWTETEGEVDQPDWRLGVVVDENNTVIYHSDLKEDVNSGRDVG